MHSVDMFTVNGTEVVDIGESLFCIYFLLDLSQSAQEFNFRRLLIGMRIIEIFFLCVHLGLVDYCCTGIPDRSLNKTFCTFE